MTLRRYVVRVCRTRRLFVGLSVVASYNVFAACAPATRYHPPSQPRDYQIVITHQDSLSRAIGHGLKRKGYRIRAGVRGGSPPTAYLLSFTQREAGPTSPVWLYVRLADTRTGAIVAAVAAPIDSLGPTPEVRARAIVDSLTRVSASLRSPP